MVSSKKGGSKCGCKTRRKGGFLGIFKKKKVNTKKNNKNYNNMNLSGLESEHKKLLNKFNKIHNSQTYMDDLSKKSAFNNNNKTANISSQFNNMKNRLGNDLKKVQKAIAKKKGYAGGKRRSGRRTTRKHKKHHNRAKQGGFSLTNTCGEGKVMKFGMHCPFTSRFSAQYAMSSSCCTEPTKPLWGGRKKKHKKTQKHKSRHKHKRRRKHKSH